MCSMDLSSLSLEMVEIINKITPNEDELKKFSQFDRDKKNPSSLAENDKFLYDVSFPSTGIIIHTYVRHYLRMYVRT